jgi:adenosine deaminase
MSISEDRPDLARQERLRSFVARLPKVELHVHLEGAIRRRTVDRLLASSGGLPAGCLEALQNGEVRSFDGFRELFRAAASTLRSGEVIEAVVREFAEDQAAQGVLHTEANLSAFARFRHTGVSLDEQIEAVSAAAAWAERTFAISLRLILSINRSDDLDAAFETLHAAQRHDVVVGVGLGGSEVVLASHLAPAFKAARDWQIPVAPHAGEHRGADSLSDVLDVIRPSRIAHGIRCLDDDVLVSRIRDEGVTLDICPSSNVLLGDAASLVDHPIDAIRARGVAVTVSSDNPLFLGFGVGEELVRVAAAHGWQERDLREITMNAARSAFLPDASRSRLLERIEAA